MEPPRVIPEYLKNIFTMNDTVPVYSWYFNQSVECSPIEWSDLFIKGFINRFTIQNIKNKSHGSEPYGGASILHVNAFEKYIEFIKNKRIAVIGSHTPWLEAILINCGAKHVTTVEYNVPLCTSDIISTISFNDFCESSETYDSVVSFSSIEHSGLGRYGDTLNPNGDCETMGEIYKKLNKRGLLFLGVPIGNDGLVWNAHRVYGKKRLPLLIKRFKEVEWLGCNKTYLDTCPIPVKGELPEHIQPLLVLSPIDK